MRILPIIELAIFSQNAVYTFMRYSKILGMQNLDNTHTSIWDRIYLWDFCFGSMHCIKYFLRIRKLDFGENYESFS